MRLFKWIGQGAYDFVAVCSRQEFDSLAEHSNLADIDYNNVIIGDDCAFLINTDKRYFSLLPSLAYAFGGQYNDTPPYSVEARLLDSFNISDYSYVPFPADKSAAHCDPVYDRIKGCLFGGAAGDALGYAVEFLREDQILSQYGKQGICEYSLSRNNGKALISDDTQMTLFTACGLLDSYSKAAKSGVLVLPRYSVADRYQDWLITQQISFDEYNSYPHTVSYLMNKPELFSRRAPGNTCLSALDKLSYSGNYIESYVSNKLNNSKGCGGIMRVAPVGLLPEMYGSVEELDTESAEIAAITHSHSLGYLPAAVLSHIVYRAVFDRRSDSLGDIVNDALSTVCSIFSDDENVDYLRKIVNDAVNLAANNSSDITNIHMLGEGWVGEETLAIAVYCALRYQDDFSRGITAAVNHNGDSDSTGSVTGNILGAWLGFEKIDKKWINTLELGDTIGEVADMLYNAHRASPRKMI